MTLKLAIPGLIWGRQSVTEVWECQGIEHLGRLQSDMRMGKVCHCWLSVPLLLAAVCKRPSLSSTVFWGAGIASFHCDAWAAKTRFSGSKLQDIWFFQDNPKRGG